MCVPGRRQAAVIVFHRLQNKRFPRQFLFSSLSLSSAPLHVVAYFSLFPYSAHLSTSSPLSTKEISWCDRLQSKKAIPKCEHPRAVGTGAAMQGTSSTNNAHFMLLLMTSSTFCLSPRLWCGQRKKCDMGSHILQSAHTVLGKKRRKINLIRCGPCVPGRGSFVRANAVHSSQLVCGIYAN